MTLIASYQNSNSAQLAYNKLVEAGVQNNHIGVAKLETDSTENIPYQSNSAADVTGGTTSGAVTGAALGFLIGAAALTIPGLGALLVSGPLAIALGGGLAAETTLGAAIGGVGGFVSGMMKAGADEKDAKLIESHLQNGGVIVSVKDDLEGSHKKILESTSPSSLIVFDE
jgi:hypothetical protein